MNTDAIIQTVRLSPGGHVNTWADSPGQSGACVMEAAALVGGERFSDMPSCVAVWIAQIARELNDSAINQAERDRLIPLIPRLVGTDDWPVEKHNERYRRFARSFREEYELFTAKGCPGMSYTPLEGVVLDHAVKRVMNYRPGGTEAVSMRTHECVVPLMHMFVANPGFVSKGITCLDQVLDPDPAQEIIDGAFAVIAEKAPSLVEAAVAR